MALSGGVDSAAAAALLIESGYRCEGVTLIMHDGNDGDAKEAADAARRLGIAHFTVDCRDSFDRGVIGPFVSGYLRGITPNPCVICNPLVKFGELLRAAETRGTRFIATGHYARVKRLPDGRAALLKACERKKDQSYFLHALRQEILGRVMFPLGAHTKDEARRILSDRGFKLDRKRESQDVCFISKSGIGAFIENYSGKPNEPGLFFNTDGNVLGRHKGIANYTPGQRKKIGVSSAEPLYVLEKDAEKNSVTLGFERELYSSELAVRDFNWISRGPEDGAFAAKARVRCRQEEQPCLVTPLGPREVSIIFGEPQRAVSKGQSAVVYDGETIIGGGIITWVSGRTSKIVSNLYAED